MNVELVIEDLVDSLTVDFFVNLFSEIGTEHFVQRKSYDEFWFTNSGVGVGIDIDQLSRLVDFCHSVTFHSNRVVCTV
jgi:hypothetical protein